MYIINASALQAVSMFDVLGYYGYIFLTKHVTMVNAILMKRQIVLEVEQNNQDNTLTRGNATWIAKREAQSYFVI